MKDKEQEEIPNIGLLNKPFDVSKIKLAPGKLIPIAKNNKELFVGVQQAVDRLQKEIDLICGDEKTIDKHWKPSKKDWNELLDVLKQFHEKGQKETT